MSNKPNQTKENWGTKIGIILAVAGSAVGLGNYLRFPGLAAQYGGGVFLIPYFTAFLLLGLPLAWSEWALGRFGGRHGFNSVPGVYRAAWNNPVAPYLGVLGVIMPVLIFVYYIYIEAWCLSYGMRYLFGMMTPETLGVTGQMIHDYLIRQPDLLFDFFNSHTSLLGGLSFTAPDALTVWANANPEAFQNILTQNADQISSFINSQATLRNSIYYNIFFANFTGLNADGEALGNVSKFGLLGSTSVSLLICYVLNFWIIYNGISKGIERFCVYAMPALLFCSVIILIRVLTLGTPNPDLPEQNLVNGLGYMWNPVKPGSGVGFIESLAKPEIWMAAAGQVFFSLSVGFGLILTYTSYLKKDDDIALSCLTAVSANSFCEVVLGGLITIPAAFVFLGSSYLQGHINSTFDVGFKVLPNVFGQMPLGGLFGFLFFFLLFLAAVTSTVSMLQPSIALFEEGLNLKRKDSVALLAFICLIGTAFVVYFSRGLGALDNIDFWMGNVFIFLLATIQSVLFAYGLGMDKGMKELRHCAKIKIPHFVDFIIKYVTPTYLIIVFIAWLYTNLGNKLYEVFTDKIAFMSIMVIAVVFGLFFYVVARAVDGWKKKEAMLSEKSGIITYDDNADIN